MIPFRWRTAETTDSDISRTDTREASGCTQEEQLQGPTGVARFRSSYGFRTIFGASIATWLCVTVAKHATITGESGIFRPGTWL
jgi:hypothetical protein